METDEIDKETTKSEEKKESEKDRSSNSGKNGKDSETGTPKIKEEKMETMEIKQEDEESKSGDSAINGSLDENTNDDGDLEDVSRLNPTLCIFICSWLFASAIYYNVIFVTWRYKGSPMVCCWIWFLSNELCVFIPQPWRGDIKHTTSWIKIIFNHKQWEILFITCYNTISFFTSLLCSLLDAKVPNFNSTVIMF